MALGLLLPLRIIQAVFALVVLISSSVVAHWYTVDTLTSSPPQVNFLIFTPLLSFFSIAYLEGSPRFFPRFSHPYIHLILEITNAIFYFSGFVAISVFLSRLLFCRGSICTTARADAVFAAFSFLTWSASTALLVLSLLRSGFGRKVRLSNEKGAVDVEMRAEDVVGLRASAGPA